MSKKLSIISATVGYIITVLAALLDILSPTGAGVVGAVIAALYVVVRTVDKLATGVTFGSLFTTTEFLGSVGVAIANIGLALSQYGSGKVAAVVVTVMTGLLAVSRKLVVSTLDPEHKGPTLLPSFLVLILVATSFTTLAGCAWLQRHEDAIRCVATETVEGRNELVQIVMQCSLIAASPAAVLPCIAGAAGSQWAKDVWMCVANDVARDREGRLAAGMSSAARNKLIEALNQSNAKFED